MTDLWEDPMAEYTPPHKHDNHSHRRTHEHHSGDDDARDYAATNPYATVSCRVSYNIMI